MGLRTLLLLSAVLASGTCSPLQPGAAGGSPPPRPDAFRREPLNMTPQDTTIIIFPLPSSPGCTTTISQTYGYPCSWDGTTTVYPSTTTVYEQVNCNGCQNVHIIQEWYHCPNMQINGTKWVNTPTTYRSTICRPSVVVRRTEIDAPATTTAADAGAAQTPAPAPNPTITTSPTPSAHADLKLARNPQATACPTTLVVQPPRSAGKTATTYSTFTTSTFKVPCGGCSLVVSTALAGYGPPTSFETTTTLPVGTVTAYDCE